MLPQADVLPVAVVSVFAGFAFLGLFLQILSILRQRIHLSGGHHRSDVERDPRRNSEDRSISGSTPAFRASVDTDTSLSVPKSVVVELTDEEPQKRWQLVLTPPTPEKGRGNLL